MFEVYILIGMWNVKNSKSSSLTVFCFHMATSVYELKSQHDYSVFQYFSNCKILVFKFVETYCVVCYAEI